MKKYAVLADAIAAAGVGVGADFAVESHANASTANSAWCQQAWRSAQAQAASEAQTYTNGNGAPASQVHQLAVTDYQIAVTQVHQKCPAES